MSKPTFQEILAAFFDLIDETPNTRLLFEAARETSQRLGQAFMNTLPMEYQEQLRGSLYDPFYSTDPAKVLAAIDYLTTK